MNERLTYRSHTIDLELMEIRPQRFRWLYLIDATHLYKSADALQPMHRARADALAMAFNEINALEAIATIAEGAVGAPSGSHPGISQRSHPRQVGETSASRSEEARRLVARSSFQAERADASLTARNLPRSSRQVTARASPSR